MAGPPVSPPPLWQRAWALVRNTWRGLTSMRTALALLFLLALGAIPGAVLPQRSLNRQKVDQYLATSQTLGPWMDRLQLFDVFSSFWFTSIYALLFISLIGCILPRALDQAKTLGAPLVAAPRNLSRLPKHFETTVAATPDEVAETAAKRLRGWRTAIHRDPSRSVHAGEVTVSAEKGYLHELGNLLFHFALVGLLAALAAGKMLYYEGNVIVIADGGPGVCSTAPAAFDTFRAGNLVDGTGLTPICITVDSFKADYLENGQAEMFTAKIRYQQGDDLATGTWRPDTLQVNHPLRVAGDRVYLQGHGFAPTFTVIYPNGQTRTETLQWMPESATTFLSSGVHRFDPPGGMYPNDFERRKHQIAVEGLFAPSAVFDGKILSSGFPAMISPAVAVDIYLGDTGLDTGRPQGLFTLDRTLIDDGRLVKQARVNLRPGETATLSDGSIVRFDGAKEFVNLQVSHDPSQVWVLVSALTLMTGLLGSLLIKRRRLWVRVYPGAEGGPTVVEIGGLARTDGAGWGPEFERLPKRLLEGL
ncbi:cytochrome c biogenesis protein ResB [Smaragdicoccus niigatensis]|nr:cytochrome c biogenesis protein ResB [Smaragdicoccus niigatensis]